MEQLDLFADAGDPIADRPGHTYRILRNGSFVVTAQVAGVGRISATHRHLWEATQLVEAQITAALAARPSEMF